MSFYCWITQGPFWVLRKIWIKKFTHATDPPSWIISADNVSEAFFFRVVGTGHGAPTVLRLPAPGVDFLSILSRSANQSLRPLVLLRLETNHFFWACFTVHEQQFHHESKPKREQYERYCFVLLFSVALDGLQRSIWVVRVKVSNPGCRIDPATHDVFLDCHLQDGRIRYVVYA